MTPTMHGRDAEQHLLYSLLNEIRSRALVLVLDGRAGIGKTTLWQAAQAVARERSYRVLATRAVEAEATLPFTGLVDLLQRVADDHLAELPVPQQRALEIALLRREPTELPVDRLAVSLAVLAVLRSIARTTPAIIAVDDLQWLDRPSARVLAFALRRLNEEPVGLLATLRSEVEGPLPLGLDQAIPASRLRRIALDGLPVGALDQVLRDRLGLALARPTLVRLHQVTGGNPFYALELARSLPVRPKLSFGEPIVVPRTLAGLLRTRLDTVSRQCQAVLLAAAALAQPTVALLEQLDEEGHPLAGWREGLAAGVLERDGDRIRFTHPLLGSIVYADASPEERWKVHGRLARLIDEVEERAQHMALAAKGPDEQVAAILEQAAGQAAGRGAPDAAAQLAERAYRLTPTDQPDDALRRSLAAADHYKRAGDGRGGRAILEELLTPSHLESKLASLVQAGPARAEVLYRLAYMITDDSRIALCESALEEARGDPRLLPAIHLTLCRLHSIVGNCIPCEEHASAAVELAERIGNGPLLVRALGELADARFSRGHGVQHELLDRTASLQPSVGALPVIDQPGFRLGEQLMWTGDLYQARQLLEPALQCAIEQGDMHSQVNVQLQLIELEIRAGNWSRADQLTHQNMEIIRQADFGNGEQVMLYDRALVDAHLGRVDSARAAAEAGAVVAAAARDEWSRVSNQAVLGFLELSLGNAKEAHAHLGPLIEALSKMGVGEPSASPCLPDEIEALIALERFDEAEALLERLEHQGQALDRAWALATAARCRAVLSAARANPRDALAWIEQALKEHKRLSQPFELGRTLRVQGTILRRNRQKAAAKRTLEEALAIFEELGAVIWAEQTRGELNRVGLRPASPTGTTEAEARVAELAAAGKTNKEVAATLFMSVKTVEHHLSQVYRKLGIRSRTELVRKLVSPERNRTH